jgi:hypothetical protein
MRKSMKAATRVATGYDEPGKVYLPDKISIVDQNCWPRRLRHSQRETRAAWRQRQAEGKGPFHRLGRPAIRPKTTVKTAMVSEGRRMATENGR